MNKILCYLATAILFTATSARAECPDGNCALAGGNYDSGRFYPVTPCSTYPYTTKGAPINREAQNSRCGNSVKVYPLSDEMRDEYAKRGMPKGATYAPLAQTKTPYGEYNLADKINRCIKKDLDSKDMNKRLECLDAFDRALNDPAHTDKHKKLINMLEGYLNNYVPANGSIDRPDLSMASEILARNHRLDRDGCFKFAEDRMAKLRDYLNSRSNVVCKPRNNNVSETDASYVLTDDDKNATPGSYSVKGPDGKMYRVDSDGKYVASDGSHLVGPDDKDMSVDGKYKLNKDGTVTGPNGEKYVYSDGKYVLVEMLGPDGKPLKDSKDYKLSEDGKTVIGPEGETYTVDNTGKYVTADGQPVIGDNGELMGPAGPIDSNLAAQAVKDKEIKDALNDPKYKGLIEENKKLDEARGAEDSVVDADLTSSKYTKLANIKALNCDSSSCATKLTGKKTYKDLLDEVKAVLDNRNADVSSRLDAICTAKCVSVGDRSLEADAVKTLAKYVRRRVPWPLTPKPAPEVKTKSVRPDVQAALFVIGGKDRTDDLGEEINLTAVDLRGADLSEANLVNVDLSFSNLSTTNLKNAVGLTKWDKINLIAIDETTLIPETVSAGYKVRKKPNILPLEVGSFKVISKDWIFWETKLVQPKK